MKKALFLACAFALAGAPVLAGTFTTGVSITGSTPTLNNCAKFSGPASIADAGITCAGGGGGSVSSVAQSFTGGLISVSGSPITTSGTLALTVAGTSGGIPYFSGASTWATSAALTANNPVIGGGAGVAPSVGSRSGNTTVFGTVSGALTSGNCIKADASGNLVDAATTCGGGGGGSTYTTTFSGNVSGTPSATGLGLVLATATFTDNNTAGSGTAALFAAHSIASPTLAATNLTVTTTHASTLRLAGPPITGSNETITAKTAMSIVAGDVAFETAGQHIDLYNVGSPGATNLERGQIFWTSNTFTISTAKAGTGAQENINISAQGGVILNSVVNSVAIQANGSTIGTFQSSNFIASNANGPQFQLTSAASSTNPVLIPRRADTTSGIGSQASGNISMIGGGVEIERIKAAGPMYITIPTDATKTDATICRDTTTGDLYTGTGTAGICLGTSSARYKHGIADLAPGLTEILQLKPKSYFLNKDHGNPNKQFYGFLAEDMAPVLPKLVGKDKAGKPNTADYLGLVPVLVKAVQQQQAEIVSLRRHLAVSEAHIRWLESARRTPRLLPTSLSR